MKNRENIGWYLVYTKPQQEAIAELNLQRQGFHSYLPLVQHHKHRRNLYQIVKEPLFPRYLFIRLNAKMDDWSKIRSTRGCISLVRFGSTPACIPEELVQQIQAVEAKETLEKKSNIPDFKTGEKVQVINGIFTDYEGIITAQNSQQRVTLLLKAAEGFTHQINLSIHLIAKIQ